MDTKVSMSVRRTHVSQGMFGAVHTILLTCSQSATTTDGKTSGRENRYVIGFSRPDHMAGVGRSSKL